MNSDVEIRLATQEDAELLAKLGRETFHDAFVRHQMMPNADLELYLQEAFTVSQITNELNESKAVFILAEIEGQAVGYAKLIPSSLKSESTAKDPVKLKRLYAKQKFIGTGIGASLLSSCLAEAGRRGHDMIWLTVWEHNRRAQDFYCKWDFKPCGTIDFQFGNVVLTDILMQKAL